MIIYGLHKNGYLYAYDSNIKDDIDMWFEGRMIKDIEKAFNMEVTNSPSEYPSVGMEVMLEYVDGVMDSADDILTKNGKGK